MARFLVSIRLITKLWIRERYCLIRFVGYSLIAVGLHYSMETPAQVDWIIIFLALHSIFQLFSSDDYLVTNDFYRILNVSRFQINLIKTVFLSFFVIIQCFVAFALKIFQVGIESVFLVVAFLFCFIVAYKRSIFLRFLMTFFLFLLGMVMQVYFLIETRFLIGTLSFLLLSILFKIIADERSNTI